MIYLYAYNICVYIYIHEPQEVYLTSGVESWQRVVDGEYYTHRSWIGIAFFLKGFESKLSNPVHFLAHCDFRVELSNNMGAVQLFVGSDRQVTVTSYAKQYICSKQDRYPVCKRNCNSTRWQHNRLMTPSRMMTANTVSPCFTKVSISHDVCAIWFMLGVSATSATSISSGHHC